MIRSRQPKVEKPVNELNVDLTWDKAPPVLTASPEQRWWDDRLQSGPIPASISIGQLMWDEELQGFRIWTGFEWLQVSGFSL